MKIRSMRKILSGFIIAVYLLVYTVPLSVFAASVSMQNVVNKPVLRGSTVNTNASSALKLEGDISISKGNPKISLSLRDSDVKQVLRMFADKAGLNIVFHDSVDGKVTLDLVNVPLNDAFKLVLQITNLTYYLDNNTMIVASASAAQTMNMSKQEMVSLPVKYVDAAVMAEFLNKNIFLINKPGLSNSQVAITNPTTNDVLIFGTENDVKMARKIIQKFDLKPQVTTFVVNHTTPAEMAKSLCTELMPPVTINSSSSSSSSGSSSSGASSSSKGSSGSSGSSPINSTRGSMTGGAASSSSSSGSSSSGSGSSGSGSSGSGSSGSSSSGLTLGAGVIACQYENKVDTGTLSSFNAKSMIVSYSAQLGTINITGGSSQQLELIKDYILKNDRKQPQAYLEVSLIELSESGSREFSNTWQVWSNNFSGSFNGNVSNSSVYPMFLKGSSYDVLDSESTTDPTKVLYSLAKYSGVPTIAYSMNYLIENKKGRVLANPRIMITNGQTSKIDLSSDYVKTVKSEVLTTSGVQGAVQKTYEIGSDEGIIVELVPFISPEGYVTMNIKPNYSTIKEQVKTPNPDDPEIMDLQATLLSRRNLDLKNVRIRDGETLVIGGMIREVETKSTSKIPVLGDLPGVGMFFRNTSSEKAKEELVIMITPRIIKDTEDLVNNANVNL